MGWNCFVGVCLLISASNAAAKSDGAMCGLYKCGGPRLNQTCGCDDLCVMYGDCCADHPGLLVPSMLDELDESDASLLGSYPDPTPDPHISCVDTLIGGAFFVVAQCPDDWLGDYVTDPAYVRKMCETHDPGVLKEYIVPVVASDTGLSYRNLFCAVCHGIKLGRVTMWEYNLNCKSHVSDVESFADVVRKVFGKQCTVEFTEKGRRSCGADIAYGCETDPLDDIKMKQYKNRCLSYVDYVKSSDDKMYKNIDCVKCSLKSVAEMDCYQGTFVYTPKINALLTLAQFQKLEADTKGDAEGPISCHLPNRMFYKWECRVLVCPTGYIKDLVTNMCIPSSTRRVDICLKPGHDANLLHSLKEIIRAPSWSKGKPNVVDCVGTSESISYDAQVAHNGFPKLLSRTLLLAHRENAPLTFSFPLRDDRTVYPTDVTMNCTNATLVVTPAVTKSVLTSAFADYIKHYDWPFFMNISYIPSTHVGGYEPEQDLILSQICHLAQTICMLVNIKKADLNVVDPELRNRFGLYSMSASLDHLYGCCRDEIDELQTRQRQERNRKLAVFLEDMEKWEAVENGGGMGGWVEGWSVVVVMVVVIGGGW